MSQIEVRTENGRRYAIVPIEDYERLAHIAEDEVDATALHNQRLNPQPTIPGAVLNRILEGGNPVRVWRQHRGLTLIDLASRAAISRGYLHQLEAGTRQMSVAVLKKLAAALDTDLDFLVWD